MANAGYGNHTDDAGEEDKAKAPSQAGSEASKHIGGAAAKAGNTAKGGAENTPGAGSLPTKGGQAGGDVDPGVG